MSTYVQIQEQLAKLQRLLTRYEEESNVAAWGVGSDPRIAPMKELVRLLGVSWRYTTHIGGMAGTLQRCANLCKIIDSHHFVHRRRDVK